MDHSICPHCSRPTVFVGSASSLRGDHPIGFVPAQTRLAGTPIGPGVPFGTTLQACLTCGFVWSSLNANILRAYILAHGNELARQRLDDIEGGIMRGLPDTAAAREVVARVAELDRLILLNKPNEVSRRYRELTGVIWDEAFAATRNWRDLTRDEKLARLGWVEKKEPLDDLAEPLL